MFLKMNKKAQAQIITTVLIILLVLAAIVIVWQVVSGTIESGGKEIEEQSECLGFTMDVTVDATKTLISVIPSKDVDAYRIYVDGSKEHDGSSVVAYDSDTYNRTSALVTDQEVSTAGMLKGTEKWCPGMKKVTIE